MNREIKFRLFGSGKMFEPFLLDNEFDCISGWITDRIIMQYTGVKDKNGKEIFEGDILELEKGEINNKYRYTVCFEDGCFVAYHTKLKDGFGKLLRWGTISTFIIKDLDVVVIGNIYETPELCGGKN